MKRFLKRITALSLATVMTLGFCLTANAATAKKTFTGTSGYRLQFELTVSSQTVASAIYQLKASTKETGTNPYYYPHIYVKGVLYGIGTQNSVQERTFDNAYSGEVIVSRDDNDCDGYGFGTFQAYGNTAYGNVTGTVRV